MKVRVKKRFKDKYTKKKHLPGDILDITEERFAEIQQVGDLVEEIVPVQVDSERVELAEEPEEIVPEEPKNKTSKRGKR